MNFQRYARLSCFSFFVNAALCTNNNIVHLVDLLSADNLRNIFGRGICYLNTRSSVNLNNISLFSRRCNLVRSTLSFPTARSIFKLPAVMILKNRPVGYGENTLRHTRRSVVGKRHLTFKLLTDCVRITMIVSVFFGNGIALRRAVRTVCQCE